MDGQQSKPEKPGSQPSNGVGGVSNITYHDYQPEIHYTSLAIMFKDYWLEVHNENIDDLINLADMTVSHIEVQINHYILEQKCKFKMALDNNKLIGFMIYHYLFESILICRGIYFLPQYRKQGLLRGLPLSVGNVTRGFSQTYTKNQPKELVKESANRKKIYSNGEFDVWENILN